MNQIKIQVPATVANLVCGFDVLGMALQEPYDEMTLALKEEPGITLVHTDSFSLSEDPLKNVAGVSLLALLEKYGKPAGFTLTIQKNIRPGSGLGSSAASAAGAVAAADYLLKNIFSKEELVQFAMNGEKLAGGVKHADNVSPCIYGGITLVRSVFPLDIIKIDAPVLHITVVHPQIEVRTSDARQILREEVPLKKAIRQWGNIAGLVMGLVKKDYNLIGRSLEDVIIEPVRSILIPGFTEIKSRCREAGALGGGIAGSGPSVFMLSRDRQTAVEAEKIMCGVYEKIGVEYKTYVTAINDAGIKMIPF